MSIPKPPVDSWVRDEYGDEIEKLEALGHVMELDDDGAVQLVCGDRHSSLHCIKCYDNWCVHCGLHEDEKPCDNKRTLDDIEHARKALNRSLAGVEQDGGGI